MNLEDYKIIDKSKHDGIVMYEHIRSGYELVEKTVPIKRGIEEINMMKRLKANCFPQMIDFIIQDQMVKIYMNKIQGIPLSMVSNFPEIASLAMNHLDILKFNSIQCLKKLHNEGIIHRDVKPDNLIIDESLNVHLIDFGVACFFSSETKGNTLVGTYGYMSPEMVFSGPSIGKECDYFSLGKSLLFLVEKQKKMLSELMYEEILALCELNLVKRKKNIERL